MRYSLSEPARNALQESGAAEVLTSLTDEIAECDFEHLDGPRIDRVFSWARKTLGAANVSSTLHVAARAIGNAEQASLERHLFDEEFYLKHHAILPWAMFSPEQLNKLLEYFNDLSTTERALTMAVLEQTSDRYIKDNLWTWNHKGKISRMFLNDHGDLSLSQVDTQVSVKEESTLFGITRTFEPVVASEEHFVCCYQDASLLLISILKFAILTGHQPTPGKLDWKQILSEVGAVATNTSEAYGGNNNSFLRILVDQPLFEDGREGQSPQQFPAPPRSDFSDFPRYDQETKRLEIYTTEHLEDLPQRKIELGAGGSFPASRVMYFEAEEIPQLIKGTLRLFARDRSRVKIIFELFADT